ncbi:MAG: MAPEG family protein [Polyangiales bacterium]
MSTELVLLGWTLVLALLHVLLPAFARTREVGTAYSLGPRDGGSAPPGVLTGRLQRAQSNFFETMPLFAIAVLIAHVAGREGPLTLWGSVLYLTGRLLYLPLYALGVPVVRSIAWAVALVGFLTVLRAALLAP